MKTNDVFMISAGGLKKLATTPALKIGYRVYSFGAGMSESVFCVISDQDENGSQKAVKVSRDSEDDCFLPFHTIDNHTRPISEKFGIGFYWDDLENYIYPENEVKDAIQRATEADKRRKDNEGEKRENDKKAQEALPGLFPHLTINPQGEQNTTKSNLVADLKKNFPEVRFSVKKDHYSSYRVRWEDGPTQEEVSRITNQFCDHASDWSGDYWDYSPDNFNKVFGGFRFIFAERGQSEATKSELSNYEKLYILNPIGSHCYENLIHRIFSRTSLPVGAIVTGLEETEAEAGLTEDFYRITYKIEEKPKLSVSPGLQIIEYGKGIAVTGDTKPIKEELKGLGGRFNFRLTCGPGWIFPASKREAVERLLNL